MMSINATYSADIVMRAQTKNRCAKVLLCEGLELDARSAGRKFEKTPKIDKKKVKAMDMVYSD